MKHIVEKVNFKNADKCHKCPGKNGPDGCPWWWTIRKQDAATQEQAIVEQCGKANLPFYMDYLAEMSARPTAEFNALRLQVQEYIHEGFQAMAQTMLESSNAKRLSNGDGSNG